jgi:4-hydroxy-tetrahydrodipicolinate synthase
MEPVKGILCATVTPLRADETVDTEAVGRICHHVVDGGVDGFLVLGSTGEGLALDREAKKAIIRTTRESIPSNMPLIAGCGATSTKMAIDNIHDAEECGADAVILTPPCFYPFGDDALVTYFTECAKASHVPVYLYNISRFVGVRISPEVVRRLLDNPKIQGIKESDRDEAYLQELLKVSADRKDFAVIQGSERIFLKSFDWGCPAGVTVVGNLAPDITPKLYKAWKEGDRATAEKMQAKSLDYVKVITMLGMFPQELKACMAYRSLCESHMTSPFPKMPDDKKEELIQALIELEKQYA